MAPYIYLRPIRLQIMELRQEMEECMMSYQSPPIRRYRIHARSSVDSLGSPSFKAAGHGGAIYSTQGDV